MASKRALALALLALLLAPGAGAGSEDCASCPTVELEREGKPIVAVKTSPDDVSDVFVIEYLDVQTGELETFDVEAGVARVAGVDLWLDARSRVEGELQPGATVWAVLNPDLEDDAGRAYLLELRPHPQEAPAKRTLHRFLIYDPEPFRTEVRFGENTRAFGHVARVERVKEVRERVVLGDGVVRYLEAEDRYEAEFALKDRAVEIEQGKSRAWGRRLDYDNASGLAQLMGPVSLERSGDRPLRGRSESLVYDVDKESLTLLGAVVLEQEDRTTEAEQAYIVESEGYAYLYGEPVVSRGRDGEVRGRVVRYRLDDGELLVLDGVEAVFEDAP
ncbi:MAG TPA: hypothetical protein ENK37_09895 [Oceanithermus profundus]|uniref:OstA family protein n=1 Tax=Oceanithermus profundus TaxID=187137 RepID=A0A7C4ZIY5_9DEIN|nr:hypothetical protein [Oceanithermus profundus]